MQYTFQNETNAATLSADCVVVGIFQDSALSAAAALLDEASQGELSTLLALGDFNGKKNETYLHYPRSGVNAKRLLLVGLGKREQLTSATLASAAGKAAEQLKTTQMQTIAFFLSEESQIDARPASIRQCVQAISAACYTFDGFKSAPATETTTSDKHWIIADSGSADFSVAVTQGVAIANGITLCRDLGNTPPNVCTPAYLADTAEDLAAADKVTLKVLEESEMEALGMGAFISVSKGSTLPGKMIVLHYNGAGNDDAPIALVGKGITFDTGGISLKPGAKMDEMKYDMCGAASVLGSLRAAIDMDLKLNLVVVVAAAENMPAGNASKPGDIVTTMSGKTVEILNTDAEGRLVLCDALSYVEQFKPAAVVDVATLTGACIVALGSHICGLMSNDDDFAAEVLAAGRKADDEAWQLPLGEQYQKQLESNFADMANIGTPGAGTITAGCFLARFTENMTWAHLDIAGTAWKGGAAKGATGRPVPLLTQLLINRAASA